MYRIRAAGAAVVVFALAIAGCAEVRAGTTGVSPPIETGAAGLGPIDFSDGAISAARQLSRLPLESGLVLPPAEEWFVTFPLDIAIDEDAMSRPLDIGALAATDLGAISEHVVSARVSFEIGDDNAAYEFEVAHSPVDLRSQIQPSLETMGSRSQDSTSDPDPSDFRLTAVVIPASKVDALEEGRELFSSQGAQKVGLSPSSQPSGPVGLPQTAGDQSAPGDAPTPAQGQQQELDQMPPTTVKPRS